MSQNHDNQDALDQESVLKIALADVPDTRALQTRILQATENMPQQSVSSGDVPAKVVMLPSLVKRAMPFAVAASIAVFAFLAFPGFLNQGTSSVNDQIAANSISVEEIEFQEAMLLHDELLFAQL